MNDTFIIPPLLSPAMANRVLAAMASGAASVSITLDLGKSEQECEIVNSSLRVEGIETSAKALRKIVKRGNVVFAIDAEGPYPIEIRDSGYVKLVPAETGFGPPTFEISGIKMHRTKGIDPYEDAHTKAGAAVRRNDTVLDTCGGFGYTAIWARRLGAEEVISVEVNPDIVALRRYNPWSKEYLEDAAIEKIEGDAADVVHDFDPGYFDSILHDPPRFTLAENLYSSEFLESLISILRPGGTLAFYTGEPYRAARGQSFVDNLLKRMRKLGVKPRYNSGIQCIVAEKS